MHKWRLAQVFDIHLNRNSQFISDVHKDNVRHASSDDRSTWNALERDVAPPVIGGISGRHVRDDSDANSSAATAPEIVR